MKRAQISRWMLSRVRLSQDSPYEKLGEPDVSLRTPSCLFFSSLESRGRNDKVAITISFSFLFHLHTRPFLLVFVYLTIR